MIMIPDGLLAALTGPAAAAGYRLAASRAARYAAPAASYAAAVSAGALDVTDSPDEQAVLLAKL